MNFLRAGITATADIGFALFLFSSAIGTASANIIFFDGFDTENGGIAGSATENYTAFQNWNVDSGAVDLVGNGAFDIYPGNGLYVDLDGTALNAGRLTSKSSFTLNPGAYEFSFDLGNKGNGISGQSDTNAVNVSLGALYSERFVYDSISPSFETISRTLFVSATTNAQIIFDHEGGDNRGIQLDNVSLDTVPVNTVSEPGVVWLFLSGIGALLFIKRKKHFKCDGGHSTEYRQPV